MKASAKTGFIGGVWGSLAVAGAIGLLVLIGMAPKAMYTAAYQTSIGGDWLTATIIGGLLFVLIGALWAVPFALLVPNPTIIKGMLFGLLPTLWAWTFVPGVLLDAPLFGGFTLPGLLIPIVMNCLIWGSIVGWYCERRTSAVPATEPVRDRPVGGAATAP